MIRIENLSKSFGGRVHFDGASFNISSKERVGLVGRNGHGKTTLLKVLAGTLAPASGQVTYNPQVESGVFEQTNVQSLVDSRTVEEELLYAQPDVDRQKARNICGAMMFDGSYQAIVEDLKQVAIQTSAGLVHFLDNALSPRMLGHLIDHLPGEPWYGFARVTRHLTDPDFARGLKASGCVMLKLGVNNDPPVFTSNHAPFFNFKKKELP